MSEEKLSELKGLMCLGQAFTRAVAEKARAPVDSCAEVSPRAPASYVINRRGEKVAVLFDTITARNEDLRKNPAYGHELMAIDSPEITAEVVRRFRNGMTTREIDAETAATCIDRCSESSDYEWLAARINVSDLHKRTPEALSDMVEAIINAAPSRKSVRLSDEFIAIVRRADADVSKWLEFGRDFRLRFFGYQTLARSYLLRPTVRGNESSLLDTQLMERPQHLYARVALGIFVCQPDGRGHEADEATFQKRLLDARAYYDSLSLQLVSNATPTLLNCGTGVPQLSSCFQLATGDDLPALFDTVKSSALISKWSGGVSLWLHNVRSEGSPIRKTGGRSSGLKRYIKILNDVQLYVNQGGNRPGAFAVYLSVDHNDIFTFLQIARLKGEEALNAVNAPDLKYALWVSDLFMETLIAQIENEERIAAGGANDPEAGNWHLFDPDEAPGLYLVHGEEYRSLVKKYVAEKKYRRVVKAGDIISEAFKTWVQIGVPYVLYKDSVNRKSNMCNVAPICSSNLCAEILIPSWSDFDAPDFERFHPGNAAGGEFGVCNLASICLENFLHEENGELRLNFESIAEAAALEARVLNNVIDLNYYPSEECRRSNRRHRPIGIGIMGLADVLARLNIVYGSPEAKALARAISATVYFGAVRESCAEARVNGPYETFSGSPISKGLLQPDLWVADGSLALSADWEAEVELATRGFLRPKNWKELRAEVQKGVRNAYVTAYMPTATTGNIVGQNECFEPFTSNIYPRKTLAGEFMVVNRHLMKLLTKMGLWSDKMRREILAAGGSVQGIEQIPPEVRRIYRTAREIHPSLIIQMAKSMAPFICQSMSMNLFLNEPDLPKILRFLVEGWRAGLKTGMYYCHMRPAAGSQKTSIISTTDAAAPDAAAPAAVAPTAAPTKKWVCNETVCTSCSL